MVSRSPKKTPTKNAFMAKLKSARKTKAKSFLYKGTKYVRVEIRPNFPVYKKEENLTPVDKRRMKSKSPKLKKKIAENSRVTSRKVGPGLKKKSKR